jgi:hypothetical protein
MCKPEIRIEIGPHLGSAALSVASLHRFTGAPTGVGTPPENEPGKGNIVLQPN